MFNDGVRTTYRLRNAMWSFTKIEWAILVTMKLNGASDLGLRVMRREMERQARKFKRVRIKGALASRKSERVLCKKLGI